MTDVLPLPATVQKWSAADVIWDPRSSDSAVNHWVSSCFIASNNKTCQKKMNTWTYIKLIRTAKKRWNHLCWKYIYGVWVYDLYCSLPPGGDQDVLVTILGSSPVVRLSYTVYGLPQCGSKCWRKTACTQQQCSLCGLFNASVKTW